MAAERRLGILSNQMVVHGGRAAGASSTDGTLQRLFTSSGSASLLESPDPLTMEYFLDDQRDLKQTVFDVFKQHPALLVPTIEGLSKTEHRQLVRDSLRVILAAGFNPLQYFDSDIKKYIYMAEICAPIDISLVRSPSSSGRSLVL
jgi:hypothetical protein